MRERDGRGNTRRAKGRKRGKAGAMEAGMGGYRNQKGGEARHEKSGPREVGDTGERPCSGRASVKTHGAGTQCKLSGHRKQTHTRL